VVETAPTPHAHEAILRLEDGTDPAAVGAAVTVALCGHWEHEGPCRWPHNNEIDAERAPARFRTVFLAPAAEVDEAHRRIAGALRSSHAWSLVSSQPRPLAEDELELAARLLGKPQAKAD
jgi:hypothetical protein